MSRRAGFSLLELLIVVALLGILAALAIPSGTAGLHERLSGASHMLIADFDDARGTALVSNRPCRMTFDMAHNRYVLASPADGTSGSPVWVERRAVDFDDLPGLAGGVRMIAVLPSSDLSRRLQVVEFGPLGETSEASDSTVWLATGRGDARRFMSVTVNSVTGLAAIGPLVGSGPAIPETDLDDAAFSTGG